MSRHPQYRPPERGRVEDGKRIVIVHFILRQCVCVCGGVCVVAVCVWQCVCGGWDVWGDLFLTSERILV